MRITRHEHATLRLEKNGHTLIIDPGSFTSPLDGLNGLIGIVITHEHPDHWTAEHLNRLRTVAPDAPIFGPQGVADAAPDQPITVVSPGETVDVGDFTLRFFGGLHNVIHSSIPVVQNVGVLVDGAFYYPGDSYAVPDGVSIDLLAAPAGGPWLKIGEAMDFVLAAKPRRAFGVHDVPLSDVGRKMHRERLKWATEQHGGQFVILEPGDSITL